MKQSFINQAKLKDSLQIQDIKKNQLHDIFPEIFDEGKIDWEKLRATLGEDVNFANERYVLNWAGKSDAFRVMQQPTAATLVPCAEESVDFDNTQNIFIEGENMEVLKVLQKSYFGKVKMIYIDPPYNTGNDSFIYPDKFSETKEEYLQRVGDKDDDGYMTREGMFRKNAKENGQYHSNWLNMMMPRLYLARNLMREDGVIFVSIGEDEIHNLRLLMNEVFGEENLIMECSRIMKSGGAKGKFYTPSVDYILVYAKYVELAEQFRGSFSNEQINRFYNKKETIGNRAGEIYGEERLYKASLDARPNQRYYIKCPDGSYVIPPGVTFSKEIEEGVKIVPTSQDGVWKWIYSRYKSELDKGNIVFKETKTSALLDSNGQKSKWNIYNKLWLSEQQDKGVVPSNFLTEFENRQSSTELKALDIPFDFAKPISLIKYLLEIANTKEDDLILDFFAGSGTTAHAVMQLNNEDGSNRKYICIQLPELNSNESEAFKLGYKTIAEISKERIRRAGIKIRKEIEAEQTKQQEQLSFDGNEETKMPDIGFKVFKLQDSNFKQWQQTTANGVEQLQLQLQEFIDPVSPNATVESMVYELILKSGKDLNCTIERKAGYYDINGTELVFMLETATQEVVTAVLSEHPQKVIALDRLFEGNDQLKTNTALQMRDAGVEFKTI